MTKTKRQLRAEAVELLKSLKDEWLDRKDIRGFDAVCCAAAQANGLKTPSECKRYLIDLLTDDELQAMYDRMQVALDTIGGCAERCKQLEAERDNLEANNEELHRLVGEQAARIDELTAERDEWKAKAERSTTNLEWLYENDETFNNVCMVFAHYFTTAGDCDAEREWLMAEHDEWKTKACSLTGTVPETAKSDANADLPPENDVRAAGADANDASAAICTELARLRVENMHLGHDLGECMAERDRWRGMCGRMLDAAHEVRRIGTLADVDGEVV